MADRYAFIAVEGAHDQAFVARVLLHLGFAEYKGVASELEQF